MTEMRSPHILSGRYGIVSMGCVGHAHVDLLKPTAFTLVSSGCEQRQLARACQAFAQVW